MHDQLVPSDVLQKADKILFVTHLALGDFTYLQNYFSAFARQYPHIKIHMWVDEVRRTRCFWRWKYLKNYALYDWLEGCSFVSKIYNQTYSPSLLKQSLSQARAENYPLVVSLTTLRPVQYARLARSASPKGFVVGMRGKTRFYNLAQRRAYKKLDACLDMIRSKPGSHISDTYAHWFKMLFGVEISKEESFPFVTTPKEWSSFAKLRFLKWGIDKKTKKFGSVIFINAYAKTKKRSWPLRAVAELIRSIKQRDEWGDVSFVVNVMPEDFSVAHAYFQKHSLTNTFLFSADHNFFQLPAIMSLCDLVISVETSVMHLANAVHIPVIALMRQKNPEWEPIDKEHSIVVTTLQRKHWVCDITVDQVLGALDKSFHTLQTSPSEKRCS